MDRGGQWLLLAYRLPREPSTPRIALWRKLRQLGAAQLLDSLAALPLDARTREQMEWLADGIIEAGGEASVWTADPLSAAQQRELLARLRNAISQEYQTVIEQARAACADDPSVQRRTLSRLRRELRRIGERDYFPPPERQQAREAVEALAATMGVSA